MTAQLPTAPPAHEAAELLIDAVQRLSAAQTLDDVTGIVKTAARRVTGADGASFVLRDEGMCFYADEDAISPLWKGKRFPMEACVSGWVMHNRQPVLIPDIYLDDRVPHDAYRPTFVKSMAVVPIRSLGPVGAIGVYWARPSQPTPTEVRWLQSLADSTALALEYVRSRAEAGAAGRPGAGNGRPHDPARPAPGDQLRMCFITKRFELDGRWVPVEALLEQCLGLSVSHGLSPEGLAQLDPDQDAAATANGPRGEPERDRTPGYTREAADDRIAVAGVR